MGKPVTDVRSLKAGDLISYWTARNQDGQSYWQCCAIFLGFSSVLPALYPISHAWVLYLDSDEITKGKMEPEAIPFNAFQSSTDEEELHLEVAFDDCEG